MKCSARENMRNEKYFHNKIKRQMTLIDKKRGAKMYK